MKALYRKNDRNNPATRHIHTSWFFSNSIISFMNKKHTKEIAPLKQTMINQSTQVCNSI